MLNLGLEQLNSKPVKKTAGNAELEALRLINELYAAFGENYKPYVDQLVAKVTGHSYEQLSSLEALDLEFATICQLATISQEGFFKNLWSGLKWRALSVDSHLKKLKQVEAKLRNVSDAAFDTAKLGNKVVPFAVHAKGIQHVTKLYTDIDKYNVGKTINDAVAKGRGDKDAVEQYVLAACEDLKQRLDELGAEASGQANNMHYSRQADASAKEYGYSRSNTIKLLSATHELIVKMSSKLSVKQFEASNKAWDQYTRSMTTFGFGRNARMADAALAVYRSQYNAYYRTWALLNQLFKNIYKVADAVPTRG